MAFLETRGLSKVFAAGEARIEALRDVSVSIEQGEFVAITGPSGSGKSTLMYILGLLDRQSAGEYLLDARPIEGYSDDERSQLRNQKIGFVFQNFYLLPRADALRNVAMPLVYSASYGRRLSRLEVHALAEQALARVSLSDRLHHRPNELSGGQRQRVAIARAVVNSPSLLFADEPTGNLDSKSGREILELFCALNREGVTIVLVTHDPNVAAVARRRIHIHDGQVVEDRRASA